MDPADDLLPVKIAFKDETIELSDEIHWSKTENVVALELRNVTFAAQDWAKARDMVPAYLGRFPQLCELILNGIRLVGVLPGGKELCLLITLVLPKAAALSLRRLFVKNPPLYDSVVFLFDGMRNLECIYLEEICVLGAHWRTLGMPYLRELCLVNTVKAVDFFKAVGCGMLPMLEVLIYASASSMELPLKLNLSENPALRVLVIAGKATQLKLKRCSIDMLQQEIIASPVKDYLEITLPLRNRSAISASGQTRFSPLQVFVGGELPKHCRFMLPSSKAKFWRIDCPLPEYLAKPDVAERFKGVWMTKVIREGPENGLLPWGHPDETELFYSTKPLTLVEFDRYFEINDANYALGNDSSLHIGCEFNVLKINELLKSRNLPCGLLANRTQADFVVQVADECFELHKSVLAGISRVFAGMFESGAEEAANGVLTLTDTTAAAFTAFSEAIYFNNWNFLSDVDLTQDVLHLAEKYKIDKLKQHCDSSLAGKVSVENALEILNKSAALYNAEKTKAACVAILAERMEFKESEIWLDFKRRNRIAASEILDVVGDRLVDRAKAAEHERDVAKHERDVANLGRDLANRARHVALQERDVAVADLKRKCGEENTEASNRIHLRRE